MSHEDYLAPVGFAREPRTERTRWVKRIALFVFVLFIAWMLKDRVLSPPEDTRRPSTVVSPLPGPR
jgi:hypothetical protein